MVTSNEAPVQLDYRSPDVRHGSGPRRADVLVGGLVIAATGVLGLAVVLDCFSPELQWHALQVLPALAPAVALWMLVSMLRNLRKHAFVAARSLMIGVLLLLASFFWLAHGFDRLRDLNLRLAVDRCGGSDALVKWARAALQNPKPYEVLTSKKFGTLVRPARVDNVPNYGLRYAHYCRDSQGVWYVDVGDFRLLKPRWTDEGSLNYGIIMGPPGYTPTDSHRFLIRWDDGVWGYQDN